MMIFFAAAEETDVSQIIGMIIALVAIVYSFGSSFYEIFKKRNASKTAPKPVLPHEEAEEGEQEEDEEELEEEENEVVTVPPLPQTIQREWKRPEEKFVFHTAIEDFKQKTALDERKLEVKLRQGDELIRQDLVALAVESKDISKKKVALSEVLQKLPPKKAMIISSELVQPPLALRKR